MSSKTVNFNKKNHRGNDWMTDDLLDLINLKKTDYIKNSNIHPLSMWNIMQEKTDIQTCQRIYKRNKDNVKTDYYF